MAEVPPPFPTLEELVERPKFTVTVVDDDGQQVEIITKETMRRFAKYSGNKQPNRIAGTFGDVYWQGVTKGLTGYDTGEGPDRVLGIYSGDLADFLETCRVARTGELWGGRASGPGIMRPWDELLEYLSSTK